MKCNLCGKETSNKNNLCNECNKKQTNKHERLSIFSILPFIIMVIEMIISIMTIDQLLGHEIFRLYPKLEVLFMLMIIPVIPMIGIISGLKYRKEETFTTIVIINMAFWIYNCIVAPLILFRPYE